MSDFYKAWLKGVGLTLAAVGIPVLIFVLDATANGRPIDPKQVIAIAAAAALVVVKSWQTYLHLKAPAQ